MNYKRSHILLFCTVLAVAAHNVRWGPRRFFGLYTFDFDEPTLWPWVVAAFLVAVAYGLTRHRLLRPPTAIESWVYPTRRRINLFIIAVIFFCTHTAILGMYGAANIRCAEAAVHTTQVLGWRSKNPTRWPMQYYLTVQSWRTDRDTITLRVTRELFGRVSSLPPRQRVVITTYLGCLDMEYYAIDETQLLAPPT